MAVADCLNDDGFGPVVKDCRNGFDSTVKFELIIFSLIPSSLCIIPASLRCLQLYKRRRIVDAKLLLTAKLVSDSFQRLRHHEADDVQIVLVAFTALQFSRLVFLAIVERHVQSRILLASSSLCLVASALIIPVSYLEHERTQKPSMLLSIYLSLTLLLDAAHARTCGFRSPLLP